MNLFIYSQKCCVFMHLRFSKGNDLLMSFTKYPHTYVERLTSFGRIVTVLQSVKYTMNGNEKCDTLAKEKSIFIGKEITFKSHLDRTLFLSFYIRVYCRELSNVSLYHISIGSHKFIRQQFTVELSTPLFVYKIYHLYTLYFDNLFVIFLYH